MDLLPRFPLRRCKKSSSRGYHPFRALLLQRHLTPQRHRPTEQDMLHIRRLRASQVPWQLFLTYPATQLNPVTDEDASTLPLLFQKLTTVKHRDPIDSQVSITPYHLYPSKTILQNRHKSEERNMTKQRTHLVTYLWTRITR